MLLYSREVPQYEDVIERKDGRAEGKAGVGESEKGKEKDQTSSVSPGDVSPAQDVCDVYGMEHFLRIFGAWREGLLMPELSSFPIFLPIFLT